MGPVLIGTAFVTLGAGSTVQASPPDAPALAARIDYHLATRWQAAGVRPAPLADDAEFLRRVFLDLTGRIPRSRDVYDFLADPAPDKRRQLVDRLLDSPQYVNHFTNVWRALLIPEAATKAEARYFQPGFEAWLRQRLRAKVGYDRLVRELLTTPITSGPDQLQPVLSKPDQPNPLAFFAVKESKPENLAAATTRLFLGVQLECAQCHNHPFARWQREHFWSQAAFFSGIQRQGESLFNPLREIPGRPELTVPGSQRLVRAAFLDSRQPRWQADVSPRIALADWVTAADNALFARAAVNRLWARFFGIGLVEPVDDFNDANPPSHPELLDELARAFAAAQFDVHFLLRAFCASQAYQRTSAASQDDPRLFTRMAVRGLSGEQFFDSLALAAGCREPVSRRGAFEVNRRSPREDFLTRFATAGAEAPQTSVPQALTLMNGAFVADVTGLRGGTTLAAIADLPLVDTGGRVEAVYVAVLSRKPRPDEVRRLVRYIEEAGKAHEAERLSDVFWALLNSAEFRFNH
jgi:hypothetical protein